MEIPFRERVSCTISEACAYGGFGETTCFKLLKEGKLRSVTIGRRRLISVPSLLSLLGEKVARIDGPK